MNALYPPEANQLISPQAMFSAKSVVLGLYDEQTLCATVGVLSHPGFAEIKRLFVRADYRGRGLAKELMQAAMCRAREAGHHELKLETGHLQPDANNLYRQLGFVECERFGDYPDHPASVFMCCAL